MLFDNFNDFVKKTVEATLLNEEEKLREIIKQSEEHFGSSQFNNSITGIAFKVGKLGNKEHGDLLIKVLSSYELENCLAWGAAWANAQERAEYFLSKADYADYKRAADWAAFGGHTSLAEYFATKDEDTSYTYLSESAAQGGHQTVAEYFINKTEYPNFEILARGAALGGHQTIAEYFINKVKNPNFEKLAQWAAQIGNQTFAEYCQLKARMVFAKQALATPIAILHPSSIPSPSALPRSTSYLLYSAISNTTSSPSVVPNAASGTFHKDSIVTTHRYKRQQTQTSATQSQQNDNDIAKEPARKNPIFQ